MRVIESLRQTEGVFLGSRAKVICVTLFTCILIFHKLNHLYRFYRWSWRFLVAAFMSELDEIIVVLTANMAKLVVLDCGGSAVYIYIYIFLVFFNVFLKIF